MGLLRQPADAGERVAAWRLAELLAARGDVEGLRVEVLRANNAAIRHLIVLVTAKDAVAGDRLRRNGLNPDGTIPR